MSNEPPRTPPVGSSTSDNQYDTPRNVLLKLRELPLFAQLSDDEFKLVAGLLRTEEVRLGALLIEQGGANTNLYILRHGRAAMRLVDLQDVERLSGFLDVGRIFNEASFLTGARNLFTVEALRDLTLWYIARDEFSELLEANADMESRLVYPDLPDMPAPSLSRSALPFSWQRSNEILVLYRKKHPWVFVRMLWPLLPVLLFLATLLIPVINALVSTLIPYILLGVGVFTVPYVILRWIDWQNDYYTITDQRVIHRERVLLIRDEQEELPISKIQDVRVSRPSFFSQIFDFGDVTIEAMGARAKVRFMEVGRPDEVSAAIFDQRRRSSVESHASQRAKIRADLRRELGLGSGPAAPPGPAAPAPKPRRRRVFRTGQALGALRNTLLPRVRLVQGDTVIYRKHWLLLLQTIALPLLVALLVALAFVLIILTGTSLAQLLFSFPFVLAPLVIGITLLFWLIYRYEDWRNDIYMVTSDRIVDIDRSPFGLQGSSRREAKLSAIQNVNSKTRGFIDVAFNMGDVIIQTAGGEGELTFERVYDPRTVQRDIADRIDASEASAREKAAAQRRQEMTEWLGIYDELTRLHERRKLG
jgi:hypothetical protein